MATYGDKILKRGQRCCFEIRHGLLCFGYICGWSDDYETVKIAGDDGKMYSGNRNEVIIWSD